MALVDFGTLTISDIRKNPTVVNNIQKSRMQGTDTEAVPILLYSLGTDSKNTLVAIDKLHCCHGKPSSFAPLPFPMQFLMPSLRHYTNFYGTAGYRSATQLHEDRQGKSSGMTMLPSVS